MKEVLLHKSFTNLLRNPLLFGKTIIENRAKHLSFTFILIFLIAISQYVGATIIFDIGTSLSLFSYVLIMLFYAGLFFLFLFIDSSLISHFLKNDNAQSSHNFAPKDTLFVLSIASYPYLLLPAIAIISSFLDAKGLYCLFIIGSFIWILRLKFKLLKEYKEFFNISAGALIFMPMLVQFVIIIMTSLLFGISLVSAIFSAMQNLNLNSLFYI